MEELKKLINAWTRTDGIVEVHESKMYTALSKIQYQIDNLKYQIEELEKKNLPRRKIYIPSQEIIDELFDVNDK